MKIFALFLSLEREKPKGGERNKGKKIHVPERSAAAGISRIGKGRMN